MKQDFKKASKLKMVEKELDSKKNQLELELMGKRRPKKNHKRNDCRSYLFED